MLTFLQGLKDMFLTVMSNEKTMSSFLILFTSTTLAGSLFVLFFRELPMPNEKVVGLIVGVLIAKFGDMCAWHFNSSSGSAKKTDLMAAQAKDPTGGKP